MLDVETSGMDAARDSLLAVGAVAISRAGRVIPADSIEIVYRQEQASSRTNILVHGIGVGAQQSGVEPREATLRFLDYVGTSPILAFHAPFDRGFLIRAIKAFTGRTLDNPWLDLAELAPALDPKARLKSLDEWLGRYAITVSTRHSAAADAYATALLAARLVPFARAQGCKDFKALQVLAAQARWMSA